MSSSETASPAICSVARPRRLDISEASALWMVIAAVVAVDAVWLRLSGMTFSVGLRFVLGFALLTVLYVVYTKFRPKPRIASFALTSMQLVAFTIAGTALVYLTVTSRFPLIDRHLVSADAAIGFHWLPLFEWVKDHPRLDRLLGVAYDSAIFQIFVLLVVLNVTGRLDRAREFTWLFVVTLLVIVVFAWLFPAESAWIYFGVTDRVDAYHIADFTALRGGQMKEIAMARTNGLITFPSFHAALGLILILASRRTFLFPIFLALNAVMIASALTSGGHYLVDIVCGLAVVPLAALVARRWLVQVYP